VQGVHPKTAYRWFRMSTATVTQAYRFALDPTPAQARDLERHAGAARFAFNWALAAVKANIGQRAAERSYGLDGEDLTAALGWNLPAARPQGAGPTRAPRCPRRATESLLFLPGRARSPPDLHRSTGQSNHSYELDIVNVSACQSYIRPKFPGYYGDPNLTQRVLFTKRHLHAE
jgi:hypothetical protein